MFVSCFCIFSYIVLIFHISRLTQDKITMPPPPHTHRNHPPITPHPRTVFLSDLSVCITDSSDGTTVALHNRFDELSTISEIPEIPNSPPPPLSNASPPHTPSQTSTSSYTYTYVTEPRSPWPTLRYGRICCYLEASLRGLSLKLRFVQCISHSSIVC